MDERHSDAERNAAIYRRYGRTARKQRAWSAENAGNQAIREEVVATVLPQLPAAGLIADVGCGAGWFLATLAGRGIDPARLHGLELMHERVDAARARVPGATIEEGDARGLPYSDDSIAGLVLLTVLSSLPSAEAQREALVEARRVLCAGGVLLIWDLRLPTPNRATRRVSRSLVGSVFGDDAVSARSMTVFPPLARRLRDPRSYRIAARIPVLHSHQAIVSRR